MSSLDTAALKIETGKYYRTMSGDIVGPVVWDELISVWRRNKNFVRNTGDYWHEDGSRYGHIASDEDLIEEVTASILSETVPTPPGEPQLVEHENGVNISLQHASDCALHNAPALPVGPCDCHLSTAHPHPVETVQADVQPVQRYDMEGYERTYYENGFHQHDGFGASPIESDDGEYVLFSDHQATVAALEAERDAARRLNAEFKICEDRDRKIIVEWASRCETAEASLVFERQILNDRIDTFHAQAALVDQLRASLAECQREKEGLLESVVALIRDYGEDSMPDSEYRLACNDLIEAIENGALNSEGA